ncbi:serine/threonine-protein kinase Sgk2 [Xylaria sp. FL0933]|nr:serine/threonine-protein kinase Sgk2 [Xylaria sp. FL0933]
MALTEDQLKILSQFPLNDALDSVRSSLPNADNPQKEDIAQIFYVLAGTRPALEFGQGMKIFQIRDDVLYDRVKLDQFYRLVGLVVDKSSDALIWTAVFDAIDNFCQRTPPSSIPHYLAPTFNGTPIKTSSNRLINDEKRDTIEAGLFIELRNSTFRNIPTFCDKFFNPENWNEKQRAMLQQVMTAYEGEKWAGFPTDEPTETLVWDWLCSLETRFLADAPYKLDMTHHAHVLNRKGQINVYFRSPVVAASGKSWKNVLVVGELKTTYSTNTFKGNFLQLARLVRNTFADQPMRRFIHGFLLCGLIIELWVFDRSGAYSSGPFNIHKEPEKFARAFVGYATMDNATIGLDIFIKREKMDRYITVDDTSSNPKRIKLNEAKLKPKAIVCRGTTIYTTEENFVAKFSWLSAKRKLEVVHLKRAEESGVEGVARVVGHRQITTTSEIRSGLDISAAHQHLFPAKNEDPPLSATASTSESTTANTNRPSRKRKSDSTLDNVSISKKRANSSVSTPGNDDVWENRIFSCLVISPAGRVIHEFQSAKELLESMRDAIRAHQNLYVHGNILHRDISPNNIIIVVPNKPEGYKGMLIDLDLAKEIHSGPSGAIQQTGTIQFMAVEVLNNIAHTYRHDLESFFYVLLWLCAYQSWNNGIAGQKKLSKTESVVEKWNQGRPKEIASVKTAHMTINGVEEIMGEFPEALNVVKPLCLEIRSILFGMSAKLIFGTPAEDPGKLYQSIIAAYNKAIDILYNS